MQNIPEKYQPCFIFFRLSSPLLILSFLKEKKKLPIHFLCNVVTLKMYYTIFMFCNTKNKKNKININNHNKTRGWYEEKFLRQLDHETKANGSKRFEKGPNHEYPITRLNPSCFSFILLLCIREGVINWKGWVINSTIKKIK